jgi:hypothetical protein
MLARVEPGKLILGTREVLSWSMIAYAGSVNAAMIVVVHVDSFVMSKQNKAIVGLIHCLLESRRIELDPKTASAKYLSYLFVMVILFDRETGIKTFHIYFTSFDCSCRKLCRPQWAGEITEKGHKKDSDNSSFPHLSQTRVFIGQEQPDLNRTSI